MKQQLLILISLISSLGFSQIPDISSPCSSGYEFEYSDDYFTLLTNGTDENQSITNQDERTIEFWFKTPNASSNDKQVMYSEGDVITNPTSINSTDYTLIYLQGNRIYAGIYSSHGATPLPNHPAPESSLFFRTANTIDSDKWYHIALTLRVNRGPSSRLNFYINGQLQATSTSDLRNINRRIGNPEIGRARVTNYMYPKLTANLWQNIGSNNTQYFTSLDNNDYSTDNSNYNFEGNINQFRIWTEIKSGAEINNNINTFIYGLDANSNPNIDPIPSHNKLAAFQLNGSIFCSINMNSNKQPLYFIGNDDSHQILLNGSEPSSPNHKSYFWVDDSGNSLTNSDNWRTTKDLFVNIPTSNKEVPNFNKPSQIRVKSNSNSGLNELIIPNGLTLKSSLFYISKNETVKVQYGGTLEIFDQLLLEQNSNLIVEDGGNLIIHNCNPIFDGINGENTNYYSAILNLNLGSYNHFDIQKSTPDYTDTFTYSYWGSPINNGDQIKDIFNPSANGYNSDHLAAFSFSGDPSNWVSTKESPMNPGKGYAIANNTTGILTYNFVGNKINNGDISVPLTYNRIDPSLTYGENDLYIDRYKRGLNLLSNPYSAPIDIEAFITDKDNSNIDGTVYFWNQTHNITTSQGYLLANQYIVYNPIGSLPASYPNASLIPTTPSNLISRNQGFFVVANSATTIKFKNSHTTKHNGSLEFYKNSEQSNRSWLSLNKKNEKAIILVGFDSKATDDVDRLYDAKYLGNSNINFYSTLEKGEYSIQGLANLTDNKTINLGYNIKKTGNYTIALDLETIDTEYNIILEDTSNGSLTNLRKNSYDFLNEETGTFNERFKVHYTKSTVTEVSSQIPSDTEKEILIITDDNTNLITVNTSNNQNSINSVKLIDISGRVIREVLGNIVSSNNITNGIYIITANTNTGQLSKKLIIN